MIKLFKSGAFAIGCLMALAAQAQNCPARIAPGSVVPDPPSVSAKNGVIGGNFYAYFDGDPAAGRSGRYCLMYSGDATRAPVEAPVLRLAPGERIAFGLVNRMPSTPVTDTHLWNPALNPPGSGTAPCSAQAVMQDFATNLHFHGTNVSPVCASDEVVTTTVSPNAATWQYNFQLPLNAPPGLDWYHPHVHGIAQEQMLGGMTGALVIDSPNSMSNVVGGLRERILVIRDQDPDAPPAGVRYADRPDVIGSIGAPAAQRVVFDASGQPASDALLRKLLAGGTVITTDPEAPGTAPLPTVVPPWKDLSVNKVEVKFQPTAAGVAGYTPPGLIKMEAATEFWRVANVSADSYLRLQVRFTVAGAQVPQVLRVVSMDGVPISAPNGQLLFDDNTAVPAGKVSTKPNKTVKVKEILLPPGGRVEFIAPAPALGQAGELVSLQYETNADSNPLRTLASIVAPDASTVLDTSRLMPVPTASVPRTRFVDRGSSSPKAIPDHKLYFSQSDTEFFVTEDASTSKAVPAPVPAAYSMRSGPSIYVPNGSVQEWKIENRATEAHAFHLHQIRFRVLKRFPSPVASADLFDEFTLRDTVDLPAYSGTGTPPYVTIRVYFTEPDIRGNFVYHCHILEHEDKGMMGIVRVVDPSAMPVALLGKAGRATRALAARGSAGPAEPKKVAGTLRLARTTPLAEQVSAPRSGPGRGQAVRVGDFAPSSSPAPWTAAPSAALPELSAAPTEMPVMRDREGRVIEPQVCTTTPARKTRRMLLAAATPQ